MILSVPPRWSPWTRSHLDTPWGFSARPYCEFFSSLVSSWYPEAHPLASQEALKPPMNHPNTLEAHTLASHDSSWYPWGSYANLPWDPLSCPASNWCSSRACLSYGILLSLTPPRWPRRFRNCLSHRSSLSPSTSSQFSWGSRSHVLSLFKITGVPTRTLPGNRHNSRVSLLAGTILVWSYLKSGPGRAGWANGTVI